MMEWRTNRPEPSVTSVTTSDKKQIAKLLPDEIRYKIAVQPNGCWLWQGSKLSTGYGIVHWHKKNRRVHRLVWELVNGPIPDGLDVLHHCDTPLCVNYQKCLFLGTDKDNHQDKAAKGRHWQQKKTHCPKGHPYSPENTYRTAEGGRQCCICKGIPPRRTT